MLEKDENKRSTADEIITHMYLQGEKSRDEGSSTTTSVVDELEPGAQEVCKDGANENIANRRRKLMGRLNKEYGHGQGCACSENHADGKHYWMNRFTVADRQHEGSKLVFEWWLESKVKEESIIPAGMKLANLSACNDKSHDAITQMLRDHKINLELFDQGSYKPLSDMAFEISRGAARLMLDATEFKKLVRVVDVVCLRLYAPSGKMLIESGELFPDGRTRCIHRLPGTKREPHENSKQTVQRVIKEYLDMGNLSISLDFESREIFEEEMDSPSYPIFTVYRKEIVQGHVLSSSAKGAMSRAGLPGCTAWSVEDKKRNTKYFIWMSKNEALSKKVKVRVTGSEGASGLVAPPIGMQVDDLRLYLQRHNIDVSLYGQGSAKTLAAFSNELTKGESNLTTAANGDLLRVVDIINLKVVHPTGDILVQTRLECSDGTEKLYKRLPGAGRRPEENMFLTARRLLRKTLRMEDNDVIFDPSEVLYQEEERQSSSFPGMKTLYRKNLIKANLVGNP